jgi:hypothetical protein
LRHESTSAFGYLDLKSKVVKILKEPQKVFWADTIHPDGNCWEVAYNPFFMFDENGNLKLD